MNDIAKPNIVLSNVDEVIASMQGRFQPEECKTLAAKYHWNLSGDDPRQFTICVDHGTFEIIEGDIHAEDADVIMEASSNTYLRLVNGDLKGIVAVMTRKLRVRGKLQLVPRMDRIFV